MDPVAEERRHYLPVVDTENDVAKLLSNEKNHQSTGPKVLGKTY